MLQVVMCHITLVPRLPSLLDNRVEQGLWKRNSEVKLVLLNLVFVFLNLLSGNFGGIIRNSYQRYTSEQLHILQSFRLENLTDPPWSDLVAQGHRYSEEIHGRRH